IAPAPLAPLGSAPVKLTSVIDAFVDCDSVAVTVAFVSGAVANVLQISAVPRCALDRATSCHVSPAPLTVAVVLLPPLKPAPTNASSSSEPEAVEKVGVLTVVPAVPRSLEMTTSVARPVATAAETGPAAASGRSVAPASDAPAARWTTAPVDGA